MDFELKIWSLSLKWRFLAQNVDFELTNWILSWKFGLWAENVDFQLRISILSWKCGFWAENDKIWISSWKSGLWAPELEIWTLSSICLKSVSNLSQILKEKILDRICSIPFSDLLQILEFWKVDLRFWNPIVNIEACPHTLDRLRGRRINKFIYISTF